MRFNAKPLLSLSIALLPALAQADDHKQCGSDSAVLAVIGDTPYGAAQVAEFPAFIDALNGAADIETVVHVGDIKNGSSRCDDSYSAFIRAQLDRVNAPVFYTPGDNEWTDCHRSAAGKYDPLERLAALRSVFYPVAGESLGVEKRRVESQASDPRNRTFRENVLWSDASVVFSTLHVVGSNNDLAPWFGDNTTDALVDDPARREAEVAERTDAAIDWIKRTFQTARSRHAAGVVLFMQADMWDAFSVTNGLPLDGFDPIVQEIADRAAKFERPVLVVQGDSHAFIVDHPLADGSPVHGVTTRAPNVTRIVVQGSNTSEWLKLSVDPRTDSVFSWERVAR